MYKSEKDNVHMDIFPTIERWTPDYPEDVLDEDVVDEECSEILQYLAELKNENSDE